MGDATQSEFRVGVDITENPANVPGSMVPLELGSEIDTAPGFILVNQSGQLITAAELSAALNQQMQLYALENQVIPPMVLTNYKSPLTHDLKSSNDDENSIEPTSPEVPNELILSTSSPPLDVENSLENLLSSIQKNIISRLDNIDKKVDNVKKRCSTLEIKIQTVSSHIIQKLSKSKSTIAYATGNKRMGEIIVGQKPSGILEPVAGSSGIRTLSAAKKRLLGSAKEDYPNGSWLGDPKNPDKRVRCPISELDLASLNTARTPEKLALTLLDYLFDRETQASSNISGTGRHSKKQLDPRKIYGIRCHIESMFGVTEKDWHRIKQNIDSKCRTAFRRKHKGMPLPVKSFSAKLQNNNQTNEDGKNQIFTVSSVETIGKVELDSETESQQRLQGLNLSGGDVSFQNAVPIAIHTVDGMFTLPLQAEELQRGEFQLVHTTGELGSQQQVQIFSSTSFPHLKDDSNESS